MPARRLVRARRGRGARRGRRAAPVAAARVVGAGFARFSGRRGRRASRRRSAADSRTTPRGTTSRTNSACSSTSRRRCASCAPGSTRGAFSPTTRAPWTICWMRSWRRLDGPKLVCLSIAPQAHQPTRDFCRSKSVRLEREGLCCCGPRGPYLAMAALRRGPDHIRWRPAKFGAAWAASG